MINLIAQRDGKKKDEVIEKLNQLMTNLSDSSSDYDEYDMTNYESNAGEEKFYRGYKDNNDYGQSDNEENFTRRMKCTRPNKQAE